MEERKDLSEKKKIIFGLFPIFLEGKFPVPAYISDYFNYFNNYFTLYY